MRNRSEIFSIFEQFYNEIQTQFGILIRTLRSDNAVSTCHISFKSLWHLRVFFTKLHVPIPLNKIGLPNTKTGILLKQPGPYFSMAMSLPVFGPMLFSQPKRKLERYLREVKN